MLAQLVFAAAAALGAATNIFTYRLLDEYRQPLGSLTKDGVLELTCSGDADMTNVTLVVSYYAKDDKPYKPPSIDENLQSSTTGFTFSFILSTTNSKYFEYSSRVNFQCLFFKDNVYSPDSPAPVSFSDDVLCGNGGTCGDCASGQLCTTSLRNASTACYSTIPANVCSFSKTANTDFRVCTVGGAQSQDSLCDVFSGTDNRTAAYGITVDQGCTFGNLTALRMAWTVKLSTLAASKFYLPENTTLACTHHFLAGGAVQSAVLANLSNSDVLGLTEALLSAANYDRPARVTCRLVSDADVVLVYWFAYVIYDGYNDKTKQSGPTVDCVNGIATPDADKLCSAPLSPRWTKSSNAPSVSVNSGVNATGGLYVCTQTAKVCSLKTFQLVSEGSRSISGCNTTDPTNPTDAPPEPKGVGSILASAALTIASLCLLRLS